MTDRTVAFIQCHCYADIPAGRVYNTAFMLAEPRRASTTRAELRVAIFWRKVPMLSLER
ncbi:hypothetical protein [Tahibacter aquaticus]|uniref:hypothetical protein n=1 Tax=Tahibacter aquaticus TaxID=520092 RepID=UPI0014150A8F|nr:hypothetical protein [Tahibacter aquaticus]